MSEKYLIGLTGNIATGKSVVRRMLEHLGAYGIDADALSHRVISKGAPGYQAVVDEFGKFVVGADGEIDRTKLGKLVFADPAALAKLENIVHPLVRQAVEHLVKNSTHSVVVIEAIKLIESPLREKVNSIWVVQATEAAQLRRLAQKRGMTEVDARQRMANQSSAKEKASIADILIANDGSVEETWQQVYTAWKKLFPEAETQPMMKAVKPAPVPAVAAPSGSHGDLSLVGKNLTVMRAGPRQADDIAQLITRLSGGRKAMSRADVMEQFGEKAYMILRADERTVALAGWQVENLVTRTDELWIEPGVPLKAVLEPILSEMEVASKDLQAEAVLIFASPEQGKDAVLWGELGYEQRKPETLGVNAWQEAARDSMPSGTVLYFKQLRVDRVLRPI